MTSTSDHQPLGETEHHNGKPLKLDAYFRAMVKASASDLHLKAGVVPHIRTRSVIRASQSRPLSPEDVEEMAEELMKPDQRAFFAEHGSIDLAYEVQGSDRFRLNIFRQRGMVSIAVRRVTRDIPDFESLHLPPVVAKIEERFKGAGIPRGAEEVSE